MEEKSMEKTKPFIATWDSCIVEFWSQTYAILRLTNRSNGASNLVHVQILSKQQTAVGVSLLFKLSGTLIRAIVMPDGRVCVNGQDPKDYGSVGIQKTIFPAKTTSYDQKSFLPSQSLKSEDGHSLNSPLAGRVFVVAVIEGQVVKKHQPLLTVESMKMENEICAPYDAIIKTLLIKPGDLVQPNQRLITFFLGEGVSDATATHGHEQKEVSYR